MFFKKRIGAAHFGEALIPQFEHWANTAINKIASRYRQPTQEEKNRFQLEWWLACTPFVFANVEPPATDWVAISYLMEIGIFVGKRGQSFERDSVLNSAGQRASLYQPPWSSQYDAAIEDVTGILRRTFPAESEGDRLRDLAKFTFMDFTACQRNLIFLLKKVKLTIPSS